MVNDLCRLRLVIFIHFYSCISASLGALSPANQPQMPSNPYLRPGANFPAPPFFHPGMPPMMGRMPPGAPLMMPSTSQPHSLVQSQPHTQKPETQVCTSFH